MPRMDATTLYIIGNGLDLHHGLPTSYSDFKAYLGTIALRPENDGGELMDNLKRMGVSHDLISRALWSQC